MTAREQLSLHCLNKEVDAAWNLWCSEAEAGLLRGYTKVGGHLSASTESCIGRGKLRIRTRRLGGRSAGRIYRTDHSDPVDVSSSGFFFNSSLASILVSFSADCDQ